MKIKIMLCLFVLISLIGSALLLPTQPAAATTLPACNFQYAMTRDTSHLLELWVGAAKEPTGSHFTRTVLYWRPDQESQFMDFQGLAVNNVGWEFWMTEYKSPVVLDVTEYIPLIYGKTARWAINFMRTIHLDKYPYKGYIYLGNENYQYYCQWEVCWNHASPDWIYQEPCPDPG